VTIVAGSKPALQTARQDLSHLPQQLDHGIADYAEVLRGDQPVDLSRCQ
jgi:hypothetical protein